MGGGNYIFDWRCNDVGGEIIKQNRIDVNVGNVSLFCVFFFQHLVAGMCAIWCISSSLS